ncbi:MAG: YbhB/YbcL family Raf kinase inhibitor-like protein [Thermoplasmata archaeon]
MIRMRYSCEGEDISPALIWNDAPAGTGSFALIMEDPDAPGGTFIHWLLYNIAKDSTAIPENVPRSGNTPGGYSQGTNSFGRVGYNGPCPPHGTVHRYYFYLYALSADEKIKPALRKNDLMRLMDGKTLGIASTMRRFGR